MLDLPNEVARLAVALGCGLLVGLERERRQAGLDQSGGAGVRTFALIALAGAVAQHLGTLLSAVAGSFVALAAIASHLRREPTLPAGSDLLPDAGSATAGLTTEVAMLLTFLLGMLAMVEPGLACTVGVVVAIVLASKSKLHDFVHRTLSDEEVHDGLVLAAAAAVVLPLLPAEPVDPWGVLNLRKLWLLVVMVMVVNALGYIAVRALGAGVGLALTGLSGGFVSSTATVASMAARARQAPDSLAACANAALLSNIGTIVQLALVLGALAPALLRTLAPALALSGGVIVLLSLFTLWPRLRKPGAAAQNSAPGLRGRPFELRAALSFAAMVATVMLVSAVLNRWLGSNGVYLASGLAGLSGTYAPTASVAQLQATGTLALPAAELAVLLGLASNTLTKAVLAGNGGGQRFALRLLPGLVLLLAGFALGLWWF